MTNLGNINLCSRIAMTLLFLLGKFCLVKVTQPEHEWHCDEVAPETTHLSSLSQIHAPGSQSRCIVPMIYTRNINESVNLWHFNTKAGFGFIHDRSPSIFVLWNILSKNLKIKIYKTIICQLCYMIVKHGLLH